jgi:hypothetical protein
MNKEKLSVYKLNKIRDSIHNKKIRVYDYIYSQIESIIEKQVKNDESSCYYKVPPFILGYPLYDINEMISYIINELIKNGFNSYLVQDNIIFITWNLNETVNEINNDTVDSDDSLINSLIKLKNSNPAKKR